MVPVVDLQEPQTPKKVDFRAELFCGQSFGQVTLGPKNLR